MSLLLCTFIVLIIKSTAISAEYDTQPKVHTKNGGLILEAAHDHNITLRLSRGSALRLNDVDVMDKIRQRNTPTNSDSSGAKQMEVPSTEQIRNEVQKLYDDTQRLSLRISRALNRTRSTLQLGPVRRYLGRVRRLGGRVLVLEQNIAKDECAEATEPCKNGGTCYDAYKDYHCECTEGWTGKTCEEDVDECYLFAGTDLGCQNNAACTNTPGSYKCTCAKGFAGTHCRLRNLVCQQYQSEELCGHGICVPANNQQGYTCICDQGWKQNNTAGTNSTVASLACVVDVNECAETTNPCHSECINLPGSFKCGACPPGYTGNGMTCFDIDECAVNNGGCSLLPRVRCINTEGSYRCGNCPTGWIGDGQTCELAPTNSCDAEKICHAQAKCEYISDMATCTCPHGMFGHGFGPEGCHTTPMTDSCEKHICQNNGTCLSTGRSTSCLCPSGYSGAVCETADGCQPNPCENGGTCRPQANQSYKCACSRGTTGKRCEVLRSICASIYRRSSGELAYPSDGAGEYAAQEKCAWIIRTTPSNILNVTFTSFDVEEDAECSHDWLQIHDGNSLASQLIGRFCGKDLPMGGNILSSQHQLFFWFRSDNATNRPGFHMTWESLPHICGDSKELAVGDEGVIRSPGYPGRTPANRECQWELSAPFGYRFVVRIYEINVGARYNCTGDSLKIYDADLLVQEYCQTTSPEPFRSSSNKLKLHFHTDSIGSDSSFQLHFEVESALPHCGGVFTESSGLIVGPSEQAICLYLIRQPSDTQIKLDFVDMNDFEMDNCNLKSIEIFDGKTDEDSLLSISCGGKVPEPVVSSSNYLLIRYKNTLQNGDFNTPFKVKYTRVCEFRYFGPDAGVITTPNYPKPYAEHLTCTFHIYGPAETVVHANFTDFSIAESQPNDVLDTDQTVAESNNKTALANSHDDSLTYVDIYLSASNKQRFNKGAPMELISELNKMTIVFHAAANAAQARGLRVEYSFEHVLCGGVYTDDKGSFDKFIFATSACKFIFEAPEGKSVYLSLFLLQSNDNDRLLVFGNSTGGGDLLLKNITGSGGYIEESFNYNVITVFGSPRTYWFDGKYEFQDTTEVCGGNFSTLAGVVKTPKWPRPYGAGLDCVWVISAPLGNKIELTVQNFTLESTCTGDVLEIRNGKYATAPLIGRYCGDEIPSRIPSFANTLYLRFTSDSSVEGAGFHITWEQTETGCGGKLTAYKGSIHSPHWAEDADSESITTCDWLIHISQGSSVALSVTPSIDPSQFCRNNRLQIYDGSSALNPLLHYNCSEIVKDGQLKLTSTTNQVLIVYTPSMGTSTFNNPEFILDYETNCNMVLDHVQGTIESPNFPELYPESMNCNWDIKAGSNNKIKLAFSHLSLEADSQECQYDYVEVWDMKNTDVLTKYHLCTGIPEPIISEGNHLKVRFVTDYSNQKNGFRAEYSRVGCGEYLTKESGTLRSPNYPYSVDLDCDWYIEVPTDKQIIFTTFEFQTETDSSDCSTDAFIVKESKNATASLLRECSSQQASSTVTSPSNRLYIHYRSGPSRSRKYFNALYYTRPAACGGMRWGSFGTITSPRYPQNTTQGEKCRWQIYVSEAYGIVLDFKDFQLSESNNCSDTSLKISKRWGTSESLLETLCGSKGNFERQINFNLLVIEYTTSGSQSWGKFTLDYRKQCGGKMDVASGLMRSNANENCIWTFDVPEGTSISLNILQLDCYCKKDAQGAPDCSAHGLGFKENYYGSDYATANNTRYFCEQHQSNLVFEVSKLYIFANNINFRAKFSTTQHSCGGTITSPSGSLASPYYPKSYPANVECTWIISAIQGNSLQLQFDNMDIATSEHCNEDYLELNNWKTGKFLGVYCGSRLPDEILPSLQSFWIRFRSSEGSTGNGFKLRWSYVHLNEIVNSTKGVIESPPVAMVHHEEEPFAWRILIERGQFITMHFEQYSQGLSLYDGYDDTALPVPIPDSPWRFVSSSNVIYLKTDNDNLNYFLIKWNTTNMKPIDTNVTSSQCHSENAIKPHGGVMVSSPNYPVGYEPNLECDWIYKPARYIDHIICEIFEVKLEMTDSCSADYVKISTSTDLEQWHEVEKLCNSTDKTYTPFRTFHGTPNLKLDFVSDSTLNRTGFTARLSSKCGSNLTQSVGFIDGHKLWRETDCLWQIAVKPNRRILLQLDYPSTIPTNSNDCHEYAIIYDGFDEHAPIMPPGKLCSAQNVSQITKVSSSNYITVKYKLQLPGPSMPKRWNLTYHEYSECNEEFRLIPEAPTINLTSPNYPNIPHPHTECEWRIVAPLGEIIQVEFVERFDMNVRFCKQEFVELFDGSTSLATSLGQHCRKPKILKTTQNVLYMHYLTDINEPRSGFKASISISKCGGSYSDQAGTIKSPGYPNLGAYPSSTECDFVISMPADARIQLVVQDIHLPFNDNKPTTMDYLEILPIAQEGGEDVTPIYIFGNGTQKKLFDFGVNKVIVRFHTFGKNTQYRGFALRYNRFGRQCNYDIDGASGPLTMLLPKTPSFMNYCRWKITAPKGQRVRFEFLNLGDLKQENVTTYPRISVFNDYDAISKITSFDVNSYEPSRILQSTDNIMQVRVSVPMSSFQFPTIRARYSSDGVSPCPVNFDDDNKAGLIDIRDSEPAFNGNYYCRAWIKLNDGETFVFNISTFVTSSTVRNIPDISVPLVFRENVVNTRYETNISHVLQTVNQASAYMRIVQSESIRIHRLTMAYRRHNCGGHFHVSSEFSIQQPEITDISYGAIMCVWTLAKTNEFRRLGHEYRLTGNFTFSDSCEREFITIGDSKQNQLPVKKICRDNGESFEGMVVTNQISKIVYQSENYNSPKTQFAMQIKKSPKCGSESRVMTMSRNVEHNKEFYKNNQECSWIFYTEPGFYLQVSFYGRFFVEMTPNCTNDYLEIQYYDKGLWIPHSRHCGRELPPVYNASTPRIQILFRTNEAVTGDGFSFIVRNHCTLTLNVTSTPQFIQGPKTVSHGLQRQHCEYVFQSNETDRLINVRTSMEPSLRSFHSDVCRSSFTAYKRDENGAEQAGEKHCEGDFEERAYKYLRLAYDSYRFAQYNIEYSFDNCGGNITTSPTTIRPLKHEAHSQYADNMNCIWHVTAPADHSIAIRFKYFDTEPNYDHVSIYSGNKVKSDKRVMQLTGNHTDNPPTVVVDHNEAVINAISDISNSARGFEAQVVFLINCNERISLTDGNSPVNLARNIKMGEGEVMCMYRLSAPEGYRIRVDIRKLQINSANSGCLNADGSCGNGACNSVEVFDSVATHQASMGKFCSGRTSTNISMVSSYGDALLKFIGKQTGQYNFEIGLTMEKSECGTMTQYKLGESEKFTLTYPQNGEPSYASNTHCSWHFQSDYSLLLHFNYIDLQNASQISGKCQDYVQVKGDYISNKLCGLATNFSTDIQSANVDITFHSDAIVEGRGFQLVIERNGECNRTYTALNGRMSYRDQLGGSVLCNDTVIVPENYNLNFYVSAMFFQNFDCNKLHFRIIDLKTNKTVTNRCYSSYNVFAIYTNTSAARIETSDFSSINLNYAVSDRNAGTGCGGTFQSNEGYIASPNYNLDRNYSDCRWTIVVPAPNRIQLSFQRFNMGPITNCHLDNVKIIDILPNGSESLRKTVCGPDIPDLVVSTSNRLAIVSKKSPNFDGTDWTLVYTLKENLEDST